MNRDEFLIEAKDSAAFVKANWGSVSFAVIAVFVVGLITGLVL